jgi:predicted chitinase
MSDFKIEFNFTKEMLEQSIPNCSENHEQLFEIFQDIFPKYRISNQERVAGFIEQFSFKSNNFKNISVLRPINDSMLRQFATFNKIAAVEANKYCDTLKGSIDAAGWFWNIKYLNNVADNFDFKNLTERVNPGSSIDERKENFFRIYSVLQQGLKK